jgi:hypothetical protein
MADMAEPAPHVTLVGDVAGDYIVEETRVDGRLVLAPDPEPTIEEVHREQGTRPMSASEFDRYFGDLPSDGEG